MDTLGKETIHNPEALKKLRPQRTQEEPDDSVELCYDIRAHHSLVYMQKDFSKQYKCDFNDQGEPIDNDFGINDEMAGFQHAKQKITTQIVITGKEVENVVPNEGAQNMQIPDFDPSLPFSEQSKDVQRKLRKMRKEAFNKCGSLKATGSFSEHTQTKRTAQSGPNVNIEKNCPTQIVTCTEQKPCKFKNTVVTKWGSQNKNFGSHFGFRMQNKDY